jgi:hypothetical protein
MNSSRFDDQHEQLGRDIINNADEIKIDACRTNTGIVVQYRIRGSVETGITDDNTKRAMRAIMGLIAGFHNAVIDAKEAAEEGRSWEDDQDGLCAN